MRIINRRRVSGGLCVNKINVDVIDLVDVVSVVLAILLDALATDEEAIGILFISEYVSMLR